MPEIAATRRDRYQLPDGTYRCLGTKQSIKGKMIRAHLDYAREHSARLADAFAPLLARIEDDAVRAQLADTILPSAWISFATLVLLDEAIAAELGGDPMEVYRAMSRVSFKHNVAQHITDRAPDRIHHNFRIAVNSHDGFQNYGKPTWTPLVTPGVKPDEVRGGRMTYVYTAYDRCFCEGSVGYFDAFIRHFGQTPRITEESCHCRGQESCTFLITW